MSSGTVMAAFDVSSAGEYVEEMGHRRDVHIARYVFICTYFGSSMVGWSVGRLGLGVRVPVVSVVTDSPVCG